MKKIIPTLVYIFILLLGACSPAQPPPEIVLTPTPSSPPADTPAVPAVPIVYYYFVPLASKTAPAGSVMIVPDVLVLGPTLSKIARSPDSVTNIGSALQAMINDPRNEWKSSDLGVTSITLKDGNADVVLQGDLTAAGDAVLIAARMQILLTIFSESMVQKATVTLNGNNIANLGISHSSQAKPADYKFTRSEIETFMAENVYTVP